MQAALELFRARQFPGCVAVCTDALAQHPDNLHLRLLRARALLALRRDEEAQRELRDCLRRDPDFAQAYRLLGELTLRRDELLSAEIFLKEALRIDPSDRDAADLLEIVNSLNQPTVAVDHLPAAAATVGCPSFPKPRRARSRPPRLAQGSADRPRQRLARGTDSDVADGTSAGADTDVPTEPEAPPARTRTGFGQYLLKIGVLTPMQLQAALAYHRSARVRVGCAAVALGFVSEPKVEWAAHAYHARHKAS